MGMWKVQQWESKWKLRELSTHHLPHPLQQLPFEFGVRCFLLTTLQAQWPFRKHIDSICSSRSEQGKSPGCSVGADWPALISKHHRCQWHVRLVHLDIHHFGPSFGEQPQCADPSVPLVSDMNVYLLSVMSSWHWYWAASHDRWCWTEIHEQFFLVTL